MAAAWRAAGQRAWRWLVRLAGCAGLMLCGACALPIQAQGDAATTGGSQAARADAQATAPVGPYQNRYATFQTKSMGDLLRWRWEAWWQGLPPAASQPTPTQAPDLAFIQANARAGQAMQPAATWIGHATVLMQASGLNVLTDPIFSNRASPVRFAGPQRAQPPALALAQLPHIDVVLISHNHYDHLDDASVLALNAQAGGPPRFIVPMGLKAWMADIGITSVTELGWWQSWRQGEVEVMLTPVQHWSARGLTDRMATLWGGFAVLAPDFHWFFAGDTGYSADFTDIRQRLSARQVGGGFDLALLPVGAYEPRWFMTSQHVNPTEAVQIHRDLGALRSLGVHWGTFALTDEALDQPPRDLAAAREALGVAASQFRTIAIGETWRLPRR